MQKILGHETITFQTSNGELKLLRSDYLALKEVMKNRHFILPDWEDMEDWLEAFPEFIPDPKGKSKRYE